MAATEIRRQFVPFGAWQPDSKSFNNNGLTRAENVVPVHGGYVASQLWAQSGTEPGAEPYGLHTHFGGGSIWYAYLGTAAKLFEGSSAFVLADKTRAVGGPYGAGGAGGEAGWQGTSFGDAVVMTDYVDDPQILTSPAAPNFEKLAQSGGANPGMDPKAKFAFPVRNNLFLANLNLAAGFDGLPAGANPTVVCWSQSDNIRQYGSYNVTPELIGTGYQPLSYDYGHITGGIGGDYGLLALQRGWVRCDGPPYTFRPIVAGSGCRFPNSIVRFDQDVYFWGPAGPSVLRGGEGPVEVLGTDRVARSLIDNSTGFSDGYAIYSGIAIRHVSAAIDTANGLIYWSYTPAIPLGSGNTGSVCVIYNVTDGRFSFIENEARTVDDTGPFSTGVVFLQNSPDLNGPWAPGRDIVGVMKYQDFTLAQHYQLAMPSYTAAGTASPQLDRAFLQLEPQNVTRVRRVRPIFSLSDATAYTVTASVTSKNKPYDSATTRQFTGQDNHGWVTTPEARFADFHQVGIGFTSTLPTIAEVEGFEVEYEIGGAYGA